MTDKEKKEEYLIEELVSLSKTVLEKHRTIFSVVYVQFKSVQRGRSKIKNKELKITMPFWILDRKKEYMYYYMIHECVHGLLLQRGHTKEFKEIEQAICASYDIHIKYVRAYPKALYRLNGEKICGQTGV